jgi:NADH-quinone oxidoreductase subunit N
MALCLFSLAGIPPLVGFQAKLAVLQALLGTGLPGYVWLAVFAVLMSLIGAFYYIRVIKVMYFDEPASSAPLAAPVDMRAVLSINGLLLLLLGIFPGGLLTLCAQAVISMLTT